MHLRNHLFLKSNLCKLKSWSEVSLNGLEIAISLFRSILVVEWRQVFQEFYFNYPGHGLTFHFQAGSYVMGQSNNRPDSRRRCQCCMKNVLIKDMLY